MPKIHIEYKRVLFYSEDIEVTDQELAILEEANCDDVRKARKTDEEAYEILRTKTEVSGYSYVDEEFGDFEIYD
jgi:hypothetical protein